MRIEWTDLEKINYLYSDRSQKKTYEEWFLNNQDWELYTITVTFRGSSDSNHMKEKCLSAYDGDVLWKLGKELNRNLKNPAQVIAYPHFRFHEYEERNKSKIDNITTPNHIHGLLTIRKNLDHKFWNYEKNCLSERIQKDVESIEFVGSCLVEKVRREDLGNWIHYILKEKGLFH